jgi:glyceraldehyde-3-phosphate dehydrogenase (NAD(P))
MIKVGVNGYGVIGKRVADAVLLQDDMELVGVTARSADFRLWPAVKNQIPIFAVNGESKDKLDKAGIPTKGLLTDLVANVEVMVDTTPKKVGAENKKIYDEAGIKSIFQGGEQHALTGASFVAQLNFKQHLGKNSLRVVSCNTTGISRVLSGLLDQGIQHVDVSLMRRGTDPIDSHKDGIINTAYLTGEMPSHHGQDVKTVVGDELSITTVAVSAPYNLSHLHHLFITFDKNIEKSNIMQLLTATPRVVLVNYQDGLVGLHSVIELMRDLKRPRNDLWEVVVWKESIIVKDNHLSLTYQVHNEAIVVPENIDAIRAIMNTATQQQSIDKTNTALGIQKSFGF